MGEGGDQLNRKGDGVDRRVRVLRRYLERVGGRKGGSEVGTSS